MRRSRLGLFCWPEDKEPTCAISETTLTPRALLLHGDATSAHARTHAAWLQRLVSLTQSRLAPTYVSRAVPRPWSTLSSLSMRSEQGSTKQQQPALALLIIPQHQTRRHAQPKMHTVHVFCTSAQILSFLSDLWGLYGSVCPFESA